MKLEDQIKAIAELDGWSNVTIYPSENNQVDGFKPNGMGWSECLPYTTSRDAIVPVIEKQTEEMQLKTIYTLSKTMTHPKDWDYVTGWMLLAIKATPTQLCEALLRATGKWKE